MRPTSGTIRKRGRTAALLELGAGFHGDLTGRENIYMNGSILGLSRPEIDRIFDDIVAFSEIEEFIDNQVKHYSSGMAARLGFAVAVNVEPEILLVDEVLSVGDEAFQRKCLERIKQFQREGRTILLVTHAVDMVRQICDRAGGARSRQPGRSRRAGRGGAGVPRAPAQEGGGGPERARRPDAPAQPRDPDHRRPRRLPRPGPDLPAAERAGRGPGRLLRTRAGRRRRVLHRDLRPGGQAPDRHQHRPHGRRPGLGGRGRHLPVRRSTGSPCSTACTSSASGSTPTTAGSSTTSAPSRTRSRS